MKSPSRSLARKMFPRETWHKHCDGVYVASSRHPLPKELEMAIILAKHGHLVYLLPEPSGGNGKNPDAVVDGQTMEFKDITGNRNTLGDKYKKALHQADNVFIRANGMPQATIRAKLTGTILAITRNGGKIDPKNKIYVYADDCLSHWTVAELMMR